MRKRSAPASLTSSARSSVTLASSVFSGSPLGSQMMTRAKCSDQARASVLLPVPPTPIAMRLSGCGRLCTVTLDELGDVAHRQRHAMRRHQVLELAHDVGARAIGGALDDVVERRAGGIGGEDRLRRPL